MRWAGRNLCRHPREDDTLLGREQRSREQQLRHKQPVDRVWRHRCPNLLEGWVLA